MSADVLPNRKQSDKKIKLGFGEERRKSFFPENFEVSESESKQRFQSIKKGDVSDSEELCIYTDTKGLVDKPIQKFCTNSKYLGQWNRLGMAGRGVYKFPHGVIYDGFFNKNGEFHGSGILVYPNGQRVQGTWKNGKLGPDASHVSKAGLVLNEDANNKQDRRFQVELQSDLNPVGQEFLTDEYPPPRELPDGCYDVVEGYFDPVIKTVYHYPKKQVARRSHDEPQRKESLPAKNLFSHGDKSALRTTVESDFGQLVMESSAEVRKKIAWIPTAAQEDWIVKNCRKASDEATGYRPDLYEEWTTGTHQTTTGESKMAGEESVPSVPHKIEIVKPSSRFVSFVQKNDTNPDSITRSMIRLFFENNTSNTEPSESVLPSSQH